MNLKDLRACIEENLKPWSLSSISKMNQLASKPWHRTSFLSKKIRAGLQLPNLPLMESRVWENLNDKRTIYKDFGSWEWWVGVGKRLVFLHLLSLKSLGKRLFGHGYWLDSLVSLKITCFCQYPILCPGYHHTTYTIHTLNHTLNELMLPIFNVVIVIVIVNDNTIIIRKCITPTLSYVVKKIKFFKK